MTPLSSVLEVSGRFARSANLERDITTVEPLDGYVVTVRALDIVQRLARTAATTTAGGAWSITGPYGSGKSSLAVLLDGVFGGVGHVREAALHLIGSIDPDVRALILDGHKRARTEKTGFNRAVVTASREPISHTVLRALNSAVVRRFGRIPPASRFPATRALKAALSDVASGDPRRTGPSPAALLEVARGLAAEAPLLIVIDEFGKNLEAVDQYSDTDPYLLQQLAEAGQGVSGAPIFTLTLQHLSFEDYFVGRNGLQQREWAKVQGRFEDIPYVDSAVQTRALIGTVFGSTDDALTRRVNTWATRLAKSMSVVGVEDLSRPEVIASCYPLHPLAAAVLPDLCSRYGQNERTLFSFLTGPDPHAVPAFLEAATLPAKGPLPTVGLSKIYDYFVGGGVVTAVSGTGSSRWTEIATRLRDTHGLSGAQSDLAKAIAVLNLVSATGSLRASTQILQLLHSDAVQLLPTLEASNLVTYRDFADEYRIWQGSDLDLRSRVETAINRAARRSLVEILEGIDTPVPVVAARHSAENDILRVFSRRYVTGTEVVNPVSPFAAVDGEVLLVVGASGRFPTRSPVDGPAKPTVAAIPTSIDDLDKAARSVQAVLTVLRQDDVADDWVARSELGEQLALAETMLRGALVSTFASQNCEWYLIDSNGATRLQAGRGSTAISEAANRCYPDTPIIGNEMINRTNVTTQGAKARRLMLEGMIERAGEIDLGFEGYGPEVAMYRSVLARSGMHRDDDQTDAKIFTAPTASSLQPAWKALQAEFKRARLRRVNLNDVYAVLMLPPIGMKAAVVPVFVTAGLLANADEVAIYEHGTFRPALSPDVSERMVRNPGHFDVKHFANAVGARREVVDELANVLGVTKRFRKHRVSNVLAVVGHLVGTVGRLDNFTLETATLSAETIAVREALKTAIEPDELLFRQLPAALGFPAVAAAARSYGKKGPLGFAVAGAIDELESGLEGLLDGLLEDLLKLAGESKRLAVAGQAASLEDEVLDPEVRSFVLTMANESVDNDHEWIKAIATVVSKKAVAEWSDEDRTRFAAKLPLQIGAFHRIMALHAECRAGGLGPFEARRITVTSSDGREEYRLAVVDETARPAAQEALESSLRTLAESLGSETKARMVLLALLGEQILPTATPAGDTIVVEPTKRRKESSA